jgi:archaellum biogenesis ATPase FlaH
MTKLGKLAQKYASQGFHVFPLSPQSKIPLKGSRGLHDATTDPGQIEQWWTEHPDANIGIRTGQISNLTVVDFDPKSGGLSTLDAWGEVEGATATRVIKTQSGGYHLYFQFDERLHQTSSLAPGVDIRNEGGYVVAPGSEVDGNEYTVEWDLAPQPLPAFYLEIQSQKSKATTEARSAEGGAGDVMEGGRNNYLTKVAGALRRQGLPLDALESVLRATNEEMCDPPLDDREIGLIARSNARYEPLPEETPASTVVRACDLVGELKAYMADRDRIRGEPTGFGGLDTLLGGGLRLGEITVLHAEAKTGKNTVMHRIMLEFLRRNIPVGYASRELSPGEEVMPNILSIEFRKNFLDIETLPKEAEEFLLTCPLFFASGYGEFPLEQLDRWVRTLIETHNVQHFFLDHLHYMLMSEDYQQAAKLIKLLKTLAKKHKVQMFLIVQPTKIPDGMELGLNTLKGGSSIGQALDNLLTLKRLKECGDDVTELALVAARFRKAKTGKIVLKYDRNTMDLEEGEIEPLPQESEDTGPVFDRTRAGKVFSRLPGPIE